MNPKNPNGISLSLFIIVHAAIFMGVHLFLLTALARGEWTTHLSSPVDFVVNFVIPTGLWIPLAGLFGTRGVVTIEEIVDNRFAGHLIIGFYARVALMQLVIIIGGMLALAYGSPIALLVLLVLLKTAIELTWEAIGPAIEAAFSQK